KWSARALVQGLMLNAISATAHVSDFRIACLMALPPSTALVSSYLDHPNVAASSLGDHIGRKPFAVALAPLSATAIACFALATSNATNASLYSFMVRPPREARLGSARPSNPRSSTARRAGHRGGGMRLSRDIRDLRSTCDCGATAGHT